MVSTGPVWPAFIALVALTAALSGCGPGSDAAPPGPAPVDFTGVWLGTASVTSSATTTTIRREVALVLDSSGAAVTGKVFEGPADAPYAGTLTGTARADSLDYATAYSGCEGSGSGSARRTAGSQLDLGFVRNTTCDAGAVVAGTATLARQTPAIQWCGDTYQIPAGVVGAVCSLRLVHAVGVWNATVTPLDAGGAGVLVQPGVTYETARGCADGCSRIVEFRLSAGQVGTWRYRATFTQGGLEYASVITIIVG